MRTGVLCRKDSDVEALLHQEGTVLHELRDRVAVIHDPVQNDISSTIVRSEIAEVRLQCFCEFVEGA